MPGPWEAYAAPAAPNPSATPAADKAGPWKQYSAPVAADATPAAPTSILQAPDTGDFMRGLKTSAHQLPQLAGGALAFGGDVASRVSKAAGGSGAIGDAVTDYGLGVYKNHEADTQQLSKESDSFTHVLQHPSEAGSFLKYTAGYVGGQALEGAAAAGIGAIAGSEVPVAGNVAGAVTGLVARPVIERQILKKVGELIAEKGLSRAAAEVAAKKAVNKKLGAAAGSAAANFGMNETQELGSIYGDARDQAQTDGRELTGTDLARVGSSSLAAAGVDTVADQLNLGAVVKGVKKPIEQAGKSVIRQRLAAAGKEVLKDAAREGGTEAVQTVIERAGAGQSLTDSAAVQDIVDSAAAGAVGGAGAGGIASLHTRPNQAAAAPVAVSEGAQTDPAAAPVQAPSVPSGPLGRIADAAQIGGLRPNEAGAEAAGVPPVAGNGKASATPPKAAIQTPLQSALAEYHATASEADAAGVPPDVFISRLAEKHGASDRGLWDAVTGDNTAAHAPQPIALPWVNTDTGEVGKPTRGQLTQALANQLVQTYDTQGHMRINADDLATQWGVTKKQIGEVKQAAQKSAVNRIKNPTAATTATPPSLNEPFGNSEQLPTDGAANGNERVSSTEAGTQAEPGAAPASTANAEPAAVDNSGRAVDTQEPAPAVQPAVAGADTTGNTNPSVTTEPADGQSATQGSAIQQPSVAGNAEAGNSTIKGNAGSQAKAQSTQEETAAPRAAVPAADVADPVHTALTAMAAGQHPEKVLQGADEATVRGVAKAMGRKFSPKAPVVAMVERIGEEAAGDRKKKAAKAVQALAPAVAAAPTETAAPASPHKVSAASRDAEGMRIKTADGETNGRTHVDNLISDGYTTVNSVRAGDKMVHSLVNEAGDSQPIKARQLKYAKEATANAPVPVSATVKESLTAQPDERRTDTGTRAAIDALPAAQSEVEKLRARVADLERERNTSDVTGLPNKAAFDADAELGWPEVGAADMDGLKTLNDTIGHEAADVVLKALGDHMRTLEGEGVRFYHRSGDEFAARFKDPAAAGQIMADLQQALENTKVELTDGTTTLVYDGIGLSVGHGKTYEAADAAVNRDKADRLASGKREQPREGGRPGRLRNPAEGIQAQAGDAERSAVPEAGAGEQQGLSGYDERVAASRAAGNTHLDTLPRTVEGMRGTAIQSVHDPKVRGVVRTVDNSGNVYVDWSDAYSADKELATETKLGKKTVFRSSLGERDLKDYVVAGKAASTPVGAATTVDAAAAESAAHPENAKPEPTAAQHEAGNFQMGHVRLHGLDVSIEIPKGGMRRGIDAKGKAWERELAHHYGYIKRTEGADGEQVDVYLGPHAEDASKPVFVIDQNKPNTKTYDESKVMLGYATGKDARAAYASNFPKELKTFGGIRKMSMDEFKAWVKDGDTTKPAATAEESTVVAAKPPALRGGIATNGAKVRVVGGKLEYVPGDRATLEAYFKPGDLVPAYAGTDKVLAFNWNDGRWNVQVQEVNADGSPLKVGPRSAEGMPRTHATAPDRRELLKKLGNPEIAKPIAKAKATASVADEKPAAYDKSAANTKDSGEELWANRRNSSGKGIGWNDIAELNDTLKAREAVKSKVWPRPNYGELVDGGMPAPIAHVIKQVYDAISVKPQARVPTDQHYQDYISAVQKIRDAAFGWAQQVMDVAGALDDKAHAGIASIADKGGMDRKQAEAIVGALRLASKRTYPILDAVMPMPADESGRGASRFRTGEQGKANNALALLLGGNKIAAALQVNESTLRDADKAVGKGWPAAQEAWEKTFTIHESKAGEKVYRNGKDVILDTPEFWVSRKAGTRYRTIVADGLKTREEAVDAAKAAYAKKRQSGGDGAKAEPPVELKDVRTGVDRRQANEDVTSDQLRETFGFKGINFGNWMKGAGAKNAAERQAHLNHAYDAFHDLADVMGLPPKAMSLNGTLGIAVGAQGSGGKMAFAAHFVPGVNEINLTRESGAGSLAHEWAHAMDHYFATLAGGRVVSSKDPFLTEHLTNPGDGVRPEVRQAFKAIVDAMTTRPETAKEQADRLSAYQRRGRTGLEQVLSQAREQIEKNGKGETAAALEQFDALAKRLRTGDVGEGYVKTGKGRLDAAPQVVGQVANLVKETTGRKPDWTDALGSYARMVNSAVTAKSDNAQRALRVASEYATEARKLEGNRKTAYWSSKLEMFARAFQSYVLDKLAANGDRNNYLTRPQMDEATLKVAQDMGMGEAGDRYPRGTERSAINSAFDTLVGDLKTKQGEDGKVALFRQDIGSNNAAKTSAEQEAHTVRIQQRATEALGKWKGDDVPALRVVATPEQLPALAKRGDDGKPSNAYKNAAGMYDGRTIWIVASKHSNDEAGIKKLLTTMAHEGVGHYGVNRIVDRELGAGAWTKIQSATERLRQDPSKASASIRSVIESVERRYPDASPQLFAEEFLAVSAERGVRNSLFDRAITAIRRWLRQVMPSLNLNERELRQLLVKSDQYLSRGQTYQQRVQTAAAFAFSRDRKSFVEQVRSMLAGGDRRGGMLDMGRVAAVLRMAGLTDLPLRMPPAVLFKVATGKGGVRAVLTERQITQLPEKLDEPVAVFRSATEAGSYVVLTDMKDAKGNPVIVAIKPNGLDARASVHVLTSAYGKDRPEMLGSKNAVYWDKQKALNLLGSDAALFREVEPKGQGPVQSVLTPADLRKFRDGERNRALGQSPSRFSQNDQRKTPAFERFFGESKVVDDKGEPMPVYHGTADDFEAFDPNRSGTATQHMTANLGTFFAEDKGKAQHYAENASQGVPAEERVVDAYLSIQKPYVMGLKQFMGIDSQEESATLREKLQAEGYDGIHIKDVGQWVAFTPTQIKSASENRGTFDRNDARINFSNDNAPKYIVPVGEVIDGPVRRGDVFRYDDTRWATVMEANPGGNLLLRIEGTRNGKRSLSVMDAKTRDVKKWARIGRAAYQDGSYKPYVPEGYAASQSPVGQQVLFSRDENADPDHPAQKRKKLTDAAESIEAIEETLPHLDRTAFQQVRDWISGKARDLEPLALGGLQLRHVLELAGEDPTLKQPAQQYANIYQRMDGDRNRLTNEGVTKVDALVKWARKPGPAGWLGKVSPDASRLFDFMNRVTQLQVDPTNQYERLLMRDTRNDFKPWTKELIKERVKILQETALTRSGDDKTRLYDEIKDLRSLPAREKIREQKYPELVRDWNALTPEAKEHFRVMRDHYREQSDALEEATLAHIASLDIPEQNKRAASALVNRNFADAKVDGVYFPLSRFGDYWISASTKGGEYVFAKYESANAMQVAEKRLLASGATIEARGRQDNNYKAKDAPSGTFIGDLMGVLKNAPDTVKDEIYQMYLKALPSLSLRKHGIHRKNIAGYTNDVPRAFAGSVFHGAHQLSKARFGWQLTNTLEQMRERMEAQRTVVTGSQAAHSDALIGEVQRRHDWILNPTNNALSNKLTGVAFTYFLGASPASALVNLIQVPQIVMPVLGAQHGWGKAASALGKAMKQAIGTGGNIQKVLTGEDLEAYKELENQGTFQRSATHALAGISEGDQLRSSAGYAKVMNAVSWMFHTSEVINREGTGIAAFRLARDRGDTFAQALKYADEITNGTHGDYSNANRPRYMQGNVQKVVLQFKNYSLAMSWLWGRNFYKAFKGEDAATRKLARRTLTGMLGMTGIFAGVIGMPIFNLLRYGAQALHAVGGDGDEPWDFVTEFRSWLAEHLGETAANTIADGVVSQLGANVASRVSMSDLWFRDADRQLEGEDAYNNMLQSIAGPLGGVIKNMYVGSQQFSEGHAERGIETMLPTFAKNAVKAVRFASQGVNTLRGDPIVQDVTTPQALIQAIGFQPTKVAEQQRINNALYTYQQFIQDRRQQLMNAFAMANQAGDSDGQGETLDRIRSFNQKYPEIAIGMKNLHASLRSRARFSAEADNGIRLQKKLASRVRDEVGAMAQQ